MCEKKLFDNIIQRLNSIEDAAKYIYKKKGSKLTHEGELNAFLKGLKHAREAIMVEMGVTVRKG